MKKNIRIHISFLALLVFASPVFAADPDPLEPLKLRIGTWTVKTVSKKAEWTPKTVTSTATEKIQFYLDKKFIQGNSKVTTDNRKGMWLANYESASKTYRFWYFNNTNSYPVGNSIGRWNSRTRIMTWSTDLGNGNLGTAIWTFPTADRFEWAFKVRNREGTLMLDMSAVATRKK
jgi:hypothetical protein